MLSWRDGVERAPCKHEVREIPQRSLWSYSLWITRKGVVWRKVYNPILNQWSWTEKVELVFDEEGTRQGLHLPHFVPLELLICRAWRRQRADSPSRVHVLNGALGLTAQNLCWQEEEEDNTDGIPGETWRSLAGMKIGVCPCDERYQVSNYARLKSPRGDITAGHFWDGRYWGGLSGCGLLDLTAASKGRQKEIVIPPSIQKALFALRDGLPPSEYAKKQDIKVSSAWGAYSTAAPHLQPRELHRACKEIVPRDLWDTLAHMKNIQDPMLGESLTDLMSVVDNYIPDFSKSRLRFEHLRLARMGILA